MDAIAPLVKLAFFALILVMIFGIGSMATGKETAESMAEGNKLMRLRVGIQAVAFGPIILALLYEAFWR
ncbi:MAG TPA: twin transmembrane helix small protein [Gammaproteobacteria bacterium]|nr:twin transmembrane helix small protein [Gammaproteobacteria bacterium]